MSENETKRANDGWFDRTLRAVQTVGFPIVVAGFLLWEWHTVVQNLQSTLTEVKLLLQEVRLDMKASKRSP